MKFIPGLKRTAVETVSVEVHLKHLKTLLKLQSEHITKQQAELAELRKAAKRQAERIMVLEAKLG